jgi:hypothetical protein
MDFPDVICYKELNLLMSEFYGYFPLIGLLLFFLEGGIAPWKLNNETI